MEFYEKYSKSHKDLEVDLTPVQGNVERAANSYWCVVKLVKEFFKSPDQRLLDFGCGAGTAGVQYAKIGYEVHGFDIAASNIQLSQNLATRYGVQDRTHFKVGMAEKLDFPDGFFDVIVGIDILHHVDIPKAIAECRRVLRPGGIAVFHEPVVVPLFDSVRNTVLGRKLVSNAPSIESQITEDERKLNPDDLKIIREGFGGEVREHRFLVLGRLNRLVESGFFEKIDAVLLKIPFLSGLGGRIVFRLMRN